MSYCNQTPFPCEVASFPGSPEREINTACLNSISRSGAEEPGNEATREGWGLGTRPEPGNEAVKQSKTVLFARCWKWDLFSSPGSWRSSKVKVSFSTSTDHQTSRTPQSLTTLSQVGRVWSTSRTRLVPTPTPTRTGVVGKCLRGYSSCNSDVTGRRSLTHTRQAM